MTEACLSYRLTCEPSAQVANKSQLEALVWRSVLVFCNHGVPRGIQDKLKSKQAFAINSQH